MKMKRIAAVLAVALIGAQLMAGTAMARDESAQVCNFSGDELVIDMDALSGGDSVSLYMGSDDDDTLYCNSESDDDDEGDLADIDKVTVLGSDTDTGVQTFELDLEDHDSDGDVADFDGLEIEASFDAGDKFIINGVDIDGLSVSTANQLHITVDADSFRIPEAGVSGSYTNDPDDGALYIRGGDDDDVIDVSKAVWSYGQINDSYSSEVRDVVYGMNTGNGYEHLDGDIIYPGNAGNGETDTACAYYKTSYANVSTDLVAVGVSIDGGRWETDLETCDYTLILGSGDDYFLNLTADWNKVFGGAGDDVLVYTNGANEDGKLFGGRGDDLLKGSDEDDLLVGGKGRDKAIGYGGFDTCIGVEIRFGCEWLDR